MRTEVLSTDSPAALEAAVCEAVRQLERGEVVALPTETVYGLAADALNPTAAARIFEAKERPFFDPLICHLPDLGWLEKMAVIPESSRGLVEQLTARFWRGPLTIVLPRSEIVPDLVTSGLGTVALRMSAHPVFAAVASRLGRPLAAPSANRFGRISPTAADHVVAELGGRIPLVLDGGVTTHGLESTIVGVNGGELRLLRSGPVTLEELAALAPVHPSDAASRPEAPGQLESHYAPRTPLFLESGDGGTKNGRVGFLAWREAPSLRFASVEVLSPSGDLREAAATLFAKMRRLDGQRLDVIIAQPVPEKGLGVAIMDRLRRAAVRSGG